MPKSNQKLSIEVLFFELLKIKHCFKCFQKSLWDFKTKSRFIKSSRPCLEIKKTGLTNLGKQLYKV